LRRICPRFIERIHLRDIISDLLRAQRAKLHTGDNVETRSPPTSRPNRNRGTDFVRAPAQLSQNLSGVRNVIGFADYLASNRDQRIRRKDRCVAVCARDRRGFSRRVEHCNLAQRKPIV